MSGEGACALGSDQLLLFGILVCFFRRILKSELECEIPWLLIVRNKCLKIQAFVIEPD